MSKTLNNEIIWQELEDGQSITQREMRARLRERERDRVVEGECKKNELYKSVSSATLYVCVHACAWDLSRLMHTRTNTHIWEQTFICYCCLHQPINGRNLCRYLAQTSFRTFSFALSNIYLHLSYNNSLMHWMPGTGSHPYARTRTSTSTHTLGNRSRARPGNVNVRTNLCPLSFNGAVAVKATAVRVLFTLTLSRGLSLSRLSLFLSIHIPCAFHCAFRQEPSVLPVSNS